MHIDFKGIQYPKDVILHAAIGRRTCFAEGVGAWLGNANQAPKIKV
jgi:hypothetical protein